MPSSVNVFNVFSVYKETIDKINFWLPVLKVFKCLNLKYKSFPLHMIFVIEKNG